MSIASEISALTTDRNNIREALVAKGVTSAANSGFDDFATDIASIPQSGSSPSGTLEINYCEISPGNEYDVSQYAQVRIIQDPQCECEMNGGMWNSDTGECEYDEGGGE